MVVDDDDEVVSSSRWSWERRQDADIHRDSSYARLYDGIEFDRGGFWARSKRYWRHKCGLVAKKMKYYATETVRSCGFIVNEDDMIRGAHGLWSASTQQERRQQRQEFQRYYQNVRSGGDDMESDKGRIFWHNVKLGSAMFGLLLATAMEPILLKVMTDHAMMKDHAMMTNHAIFDYRYVLTQLLTLAHVPLAIGSAIWYVVKYSPTAMESCAFPKLWFVLLAFLNSLHMLMLVVPCGAVPAPLTVLLVHSQVPFTKIISGLFTLGLICFEYFVPSLPEPQWAPSNVEIMLNNQYNISSSHRQNMDSKQAPFFTRVMGVFRKFIWKRPKAIVSMLFIVTGVIVGMYPVIDKDADALGLNSFCYAFHQECASSTLIFLFAAVPAALSSVCVERTLVSYSVPVSPVLLHAWIVPMQFIFQTILAPLGRHLQYPTGKWGNVSTELRGFDVEVKEALRCIILGKESGFVVVDVDHDWCKPLLPLVFLFLVVSFSFHMLTLYVMKLGTEMSLRLCTALAVPMAWGILAFYDLEFPTGVTSDVPTQAVVSTYSKVSMMLVVVGILFHQTVVEPETNYILTSPFEERDRMQIEATSEQHRRELMRVLNSGQNTNMFDLDDEDEGRMARAATTNEGDLDADDDDEEEEEEDEEDDDDDYFS